MTTTGDPRLDRLDPRDRAYIEKLDAEQRETVVSTLVRYRREPQVGVGDTVPELSVLRLDGHAHERLPDLAADKPLALVFGSFT